jgi:hypothetical protein
MARRRQVVLERGWVAALSAVGVADVLLASRTHPFTRGADVVTAVPLVLAAVAVALRARPAGAVETGVVDGRTERQSRMLGIDAAFVGVAPIASVTAWELYCLFTLPRSVHPTLSSLLDMLDANPAGKAVAFAAWLVLGWLLVVA